MPKPAFFTALLAAILACFPLSVLAQQTNQRTQTITVNNDAEAIRIQQAEFRRDVASGKGRFKDMSKKGKRDFAIHQDTVEQLLAGGIQRTTELNEDDQVKLLNALEAISAILNKAEDDRLVCERKSNIGSNMRVTTCMTVVERREMRESVDNERQLPKTGCSIANGGRSCGAD